LKALEVKEVSLNEFLNVLSVLVKHGVRLKEEVYLKVVGKAMEIAENSEAIGFSLYRF